VVDHRDRVAPAVALAGWCGFAWYVFWQGTTGVPIIWTDSTSYAAVAGHPLLSTGFWAGQRPPLVPLLLKLVNSSTGFVAMQSVVAVAAWGLLAFTVGALLAPGWRRVVAVWAVLAFASSTPITLWNRSVLSESLSLSLVAALVAAVIWTARGVTWPRVAAVVLLGLALAATRDAQVWTTGALGLVVAVVALYRRFRAGRFSPRLLGLAAGLIVAAGLTGWVTIHTGRTRQNAANVFFVRVFPFPSRVAWFAGHGMPDARQIDALAASARPPQPGAAKVVDPIPAYPAVGRWIDTHGQTDYFLYALTHPAFVFTEPLQRPERSFNFANGDLTFYAAQGRVDSPLSSLLWPAWWWLLPMSVVAIAASLYRRRWRERSWLAVVMLAALGVFTMLVAWNGDGQEVTRHTIEGFAELRVCVLIAATVGVLGLAKPTARRAPGTPGAEAGAEPDGGTTEEDVERGEGRPGPGQASVVGGQGGVQA
jgi:hypothetical protein